MKYTYFIYLNSYSCHEGPGKFKNNTNATKKQNMFAYKKIKSSDAQIDKKKYGY